MDWLKYTLGSSTAADDSFLCLRAITYDILTYTYNITPIGMKNEPIAEKIT